MEGTYISPLPQSSDDIFASKKRKQEADLIANMYRKRSKQQNTDASQELIHHHAMHATSGDHPRFIPPAQEETTIIGGEQVSCNIAAAADLPYSTYLIFRRTMNQTKMR